MNIYIETDAPGMRRQYRGYGAVVEFLRSNGIPEKRDAYGLEDATGNQIMLIALAEALKLLAKPCDITIYMDNRYVSEHIRNGSVYEWLDTGWKTVRNEPVKNAEEWKEILRLIEGHDITFAYAGKNPHRDKMQKEIKDIRDRGIQWKQQKLEQ